MLDLLKQVFRKILIDADSFVFFVESIFYLCLTTKIGFTRINLDSATCKEILHKCIGIQIRRWDYAFASGYGGLFPLLYTHP